MSKILKIILTIFIFTVLLGCASGSGSSIITGEVRPAINPAEVRIYLEPPSQYEVIGLVEAYSDVNFSRQAAQNRLMERLKKRAAKMGANGVLLTDTGSKSSQTMGMGFMMGSDSSSFFLGSADSSDRMTAQGRAIYVIQE